MLRQSVLIISVYGKYQKPHSAVHYLCLTKSDREFCLSDIPQVTEVLVQYPNFFVIEKSISARPHRHFSSSVALITNSVIMARASLKVGQELKYVYTNRSQWCKN